MPIRTIVDRAIESAEHGNGGILLNGTDGSSSNENSFLVLDASKSATIDVNEKIEFEQETIAEENIESTVKSLNFDAIKLENEDGNVLLDTDESDRLVYDQVFNPSTFNIGSTLTAGNAIKVDSSGSGFEFGVAGPDIYWATYATTDQTSLTNNTITTVVYNAVRSQSSHGGYDTSNGKFTVPVDGDGIYDMSAMVTIGGSGTANNPTRSVYTWIYINGSNGRARAGNFLIDNSYEGTQGSNSPVRLIYPLVAGDTVEVKGQAYGNNHSFDASTSNSFFGGFRVVAGTFSVG